MTHRKSFRGGGIAKPLSVFIGVVTGLLAVFAVGAQTSGVALQYHRISDSGPAITRTSAAYFGDHLELIERLGFPVVALDKLLNGLCHDDTESPSAIALTFDDAHRTVYEQAWPLLKERNWPFIVFVNTAAVDGSHGGTMSWDQLRELAQAGVIIGNHGVDHQHLIRKPADQTREQWAAWQRKQIIDAQQRIDSELGPQPKIFAYPYGEYDLASAAILKELGYSAFGQQSGAFGCSSPLQALPRFPVSGPYANPESVELKLASLPFPTVGRLVEPVLPPGERHPRLVLHLSPADTDGFDPLNANCFATGQGAIQARWDPEQQALLVQADEPLPSGRSRYNCTVRNTIQQRYHWYSQPWFIADESGQWPAE